MVLPAAALAWALAANSLIYVAVPRMPLYQVSALRLVAAWPTMTSLFSGINVSAKMQAGLSVHNANFVGANVHGVLMDMYYADWYGDLQHIGDLRDRGASESARSCDANEMVYNEITFESKCPAETSKYPLLSVSARQTTMSDEDLVYMNLRNVSPGTQYQMAKDALLSRGKIEILTSGVLHVKQPNLGLPMSVGLVCSNSFDLVTFPWLVAGHDCIIDSIIPGWSSIEEHGRRIRKKTLKKHRETGKVLDVRKEKSNSNGDPIGMQIDGMELEWHI